jgi:hypothetical protein
MVPKPGQERRLEELLEKLSNYYVAESGYVLGYRLQPYEGDPHRRMGRFGVWATEEDAVRAAQTEHGMALRADLMRVIDEDTHVELSFIGQPDV